MESGFRRLPVGLDPYVFRDAMAQLGAAVTIVTTDGPAGRAGFTASAVCGVADNPPTLLVCVNRGSSAYAAFIGNGVLCVNVLAGGHAALSHLFGGKTAMADRFAAGEWLTLKTGAPALETAVVNLDCRLTRSVDVGTHAVLFSEVERIRHGPAPDALFYFRREYRVLRSRAGR